MKLITKLITVVLIITMLGTQVTAANKVEHSGKADALKAIGLFSGTAKGYELDRAPSRIEAAVMLIRLLGQEAEAKALNSPHPFTDVDSWADPYVGYMYANGLSTGIGNDLFGSNRATDGKTFATFVLRALGYNDAAGDFAWATALDFAVKQQVMTDAELKNLSGQVFMRDEMVFLAYQGLKAKQKDSQVSLVDRLITEGKVATDKAVIAGIADKTKYRESLMPKVFAEGTIAGIDSSQETSGYFSDNANLYKSGKYYYSFSVEQIEGLTMNSVAKVEFYLKGTKVKTLYSVSNHEYVSGNRKTIYYNLHIKSEPFDSIKYQVTGINEFLVSDMYYPVKITRLKASECKKALPLFQKAGYLATNEAQTFEKTWSDSALTLASIVSDQSIYANGDVVHFKSYTLDDKEVTENLFKNNHYKVTAGIPITMSTSTTYLSQVMISHYGDHIPIGFEIVVNTNEDSYFVIRDANYKVTDIVLFTK